MPLDTETRCLQIWQVLIASAMNRQTIHYKTITDALDWRMLPYGVGTPYLDRIFAFCRSQGVPDVTTIVVNADTGRPGYYTGENWDRDRETVYATNWFALVPPSREDFANPTE